MPPPPPPTVAALRAALEPRGGPGDAHYGKRFRQMCFAVDDVGVDGAASVFPFTVTELMANSVDTLHGGNAAWAVDTFSSAHATAVLGHARHVTVQLDLKYYVAAPVGARVAAVCRLQRLGRRIVFLDARIVAADDPAVVYVVAHHVKALQHGRPGDPPAQEASQEAEQEAPSVASSGAGGADSAPVSKL